MGAASEIGGPYSVLICMAFQWRKGRKKERKKEGKKERKKKVAVGGGDRAVNGRGPFRAAAEKEKEPIPGRRHEERTCATGLPSLTGVWRTPAVDQDELADRRIGRDQRASGQPGHHVVAGVAIHGPRRHRLHPVIELAHGESGGDLVEHSPLAVATMASVARKQRRGGCRRALAVVVLERASITQLTLSPDSRQEVLQGSTFCLTFLYEICSVPGAFSPK